MEYGPVPEERVDELRELLAYGFRPEAGPRPFDPDDWERAASVLRVHDTDHDSQGKRVRLYGPAETSLLDLVDDPAAVEELTASGGIAVAPAAREVLAAAFPPRDVFLRDGF